MMKQIALKQLHSCRQLLLWLKSWSKDSSGASVEWHGARSVPTLGAAGNRLSMAELSGRTVQYGYDDLYRLTSENIVCGTGTPACAPGAVSYSYDSVGNRLQLISTLSAVPASGLLNYDANDRTSTDVYDANGNTVFNGQQNVYDFENRLVGAAAC